MATTPEKMSNGNEAQFMGNLLGAELSQPPLIERGGFSFINPSAEMASLKEADVRERVAASRLGRVALVSQVPEPDPNTDLIRHHQLFSLDQDGYRHAFWVTEATEGDGVHAKFNIFNLPAFAESVDNGIGFRMHASLAREFPAAQVITIASNGTGKTGGGFSPQGIKNFRLDTMAEQRHELIKVLDGTAPNIMVGTSMGSIIGNKILNLDIADGKTLNIAGACWYAPALVPPKRVPLDVALRFFPELIKDGTEEIVFRTARGKIAGSLALLLTGLRGERPSNLLAYGVSAADILKGTPIDEIKRPLDHYQTAVIAGTTDPVGQLDMWRALESTHDNLTVKVVQGRGHGMTLNPEKSAAKIAKTLRSQKIVTA